MKYSKMPLFFLAAVMIISLTAGVVYGQVPRKAPKNIYTPPEENYGFIPPPMDLSHIQPVSPHYLTTLQPPATWDWRALGGVTSVKNQNPYGTCWAFCALGDLESKVLINDSYGPDYSELNIVACNAQGTTCNSGGNTYITTNYLALLGSVDETCDPYPGGCPNPTCINPACSFLKRVAEWRLIADDVTTIKNAVMTHGPVTTSMDADIPGFSTYDGSYCITYTGPVELNHCVLIVGWDDDMCGGNGAWIVKNSWGAGWGDAGYFYIQYEHAGIGQYSTVITAYEDYDPNVTFYYYDEWGWWSSVGFGDGLDWGMVEFTPLSNDLLYSVDFWATGSPTTYAVYVYDDFSGGTLSNLLAGPIGGTVQEAGYYSVDLVSPLQLTIGDMIYVAIEFNTYAYTYPVPMDDSGPMETNRCFISNDGTSWSALDNGGYAMGDVGIRGVVAPEQEESGCLMEGDPGLYVDFGQDTDVIIAGATNTYTLGCANFGFVSATCPDPDTFCCDVVLETAGWTVTGDPPLGDCHIVDPGYLWWQDINVTAPCEVEPCDYDTIIVGMFFCDTLGVCAPSCGDCEDPNWYGGNPYYQKDTLIIHVIEAPPALYILQDSIYYVDQGQTAAYIPFSICNGDPCADPQDYGYCISNKGWVGGPIVQCDTVEGVPGGECKDVYGIIDAGFADICDYDTLTIIAWSVALPVIY
ncbi:MAG: hypothetical protein JSV33_00220, partial [bacterium]